MFEGLRDEVDKARWKQQTKQWKKTAAPILAVKPRHILAAWPAALYSGVPDADCEATLVVYYYPPLPKRTEVWCVRVDVIVSAAVGTPIRFRGYENGGIYGWVSHMQERVWPSDWALDEEGMAGLHQAAAVVQELSDEEIGHIQATAQVGDQAPPGYKWINPDVLSRAAEETSSHEADPDRR